MNFKFFLVTVFAVFILIYVTSCSNRNDVIAIEDDVTLRVTSENRSNETVWMEELEGKRLIERVPRLEKISTSVTINPQSVSVASVSKALYPFVHDFGSLDTSSISYSVRLVADGFCSSFVSDAPIENYENLMQEDMIFSLVFFLKDISEITGISEKSDAKNNFFSSYMMGAPFRNEGTYEIPVRFFCSKGTIDCAIFISSAADEPKISQLKIIKINF